MDDHGEIIIYQTEDGLTKIDVSMQDETVWLSLEQMADLFNEINLPYLSILKTSLKMENWCENQLLQNLQQFKMREIYQKRLCNG